MEKIIYIFSSLVLISTISVSRAQDASIIRPGLIRTQLTISPSYMFSDKQSYFYLHGNLEGYLEKNISLAGEGYFSLGNTASDKSIFDYNHSMFFGINWHFTKKNNDLYVGIQPGLSFTKLNTAENNLTNMTNGINPLFSSVVGYNFYLNKIFHFFLQSRILVGQHSYDISKDLTELRFSAGLGFNINAMKPK